jgi:hypothetical protein
MESIRQMIGTVYLAFANAVGEDALEEANQTIIDSVESGAVNDIYARSALMTLVRSCRKPERA